MQSRLRMQFDNVVRCSYIAHYANDSEKALMHAYAGVTCTLISLNHRLFNATTITSSQSFAHEELLLLHQRMLRTFTTM